MDNNDINRPFKRLVISGGGIKGYSILGALFYLESTNLLSKVHDFYGTSIGSLICLFLAIGFTSTEIFTHFYENDKLMDPYQISKTLRENIALLPISILGDRIRPILQQKLGNPDPTFTELYEFTGNNINIIGTNINTASMEHFCPQHTPHMKIIDAIEISCCLPFLFSKKIYKNNVYIDGSLVNNYPVDLADNGIDKVIGISVVEKLDEISECNQLTWMYRIMMIPMFELYKTRLNDIGPHVKSIDLKINVNVYNINISTEQKIKLFVDGHKMAKCIFEKNGDKNVDSKNSDHTLKNIKRRPKIKMD